MTLILGIDPGSRITGYGVVRDTGRGCEYVASGCIRTGDGPLPERLQKVYRGVREVIRLHGPVMLGIEQVFMARNADSALKLGQARGAAICAAVLRDLPVHEYTPMQVKQSLVGRGAAEKGQVQHMVGVVLGIPGPIQADAADALAIAITHAHARGLAGQAGLLAAAMLKRRGTRR